MNRRTAFGRITAIGGLIASAALLAGAAGARADELSDLRANNQLLQRRLDELSRGRDKLDPAAGAGLGAGGLPRSFLSPGTDTSIRIGGSVTGTVQYGRQ